MSAPTYRRIIAVDFDGTLAKTKFPQIIEPIARNIRLCKRLQAAGAILILWTCRCGQDLDDAVEWCRAQGLEFDYINENVPDNIERWGNDSRKIFAHEYIDDKATNPEAERQAIWKYRKRIKAAWTAMAVCSGAAAVAAVVNLITTIFL